MATRLVRLCSPLRILTADLGLFKRSARNSHSASFARFSRAGARRRIFSAPSTTPETSSRLARGCTRTANVTVPFSSFTLSTVFGLRRLPRAKKRRAHAHFRCAFFDGRFEIVRHAHGEHGQVATQSRFQRIAKLAQFVQIWSHFVDAFEKWRNTHQSRKIQVWKSKNSLG